MGEQRDLFSQYVFMGEDVKKIVIGILGVIILFAGVSLVCYPFISNYLMSQNQNSEIEAQQSFIEEVDNSRIDEAFAAAEAYNKSLLGNVVLTDPFDPGTQTEKDVTYENLLNINQDSLMASIEIPRIRVKLPVYHGTDQDTLLNGVGHLQKTSLPVGGRGTHAVLTGHTGLSTAKLFTDLNQLEQGDVFYIHVLDKTLAYKVDQIKVVEPADTSDLRINNEEDYVTLVTCTPYGVNSHRLLVRGTRIPYEEAEKIVENTKPTESTWMLEYKRALLAGAGVLLMIILIFIIIRLGVIRHRKRKAGKNR